MGPLLWQMSVLGRGPLLGRLFPCLSELLLLLLMLLQNLVISVHNKLLLPLLFLLLLLLLLELFDCRRYGRGRRGCW